MKNKKGVVPLSVLLVTGLLGAILGVSFNETARNGVLKQNGKKIWCQMQNKGKAYCSNLPQ